MEVTEKEKFVNLWPVEAQTSSVAQEDCIEEGDVLQLEPDPPPLLVESNDPHYAQVQEDVAPVSRWPSEISYEMYESELQMPAIMKLMKAALSEPYSIYTYRYFIHNWPQLCVVALCGDCCVGAIVCKLEIHHYSTRRGYIAMLAVDENYRKRKIGKGSLILLSTMSFLCEYFYYHNAFK